MSRRIAVDLYDANHPTAARMAQRPRRRRGDQGRHDRLRQRPASITSPTCAISARRKALSERFKDPDDPLKLVIVRDMWLTGFDAPPLHTMYVDKPMRGHSLMQAIARVNRVYKDKPGGLIVDYLGIAPDLKEAHGALHLRDERPRMTTSRRRPHRANQPGRGRDDD